MRLPWSQWHEQLHAATGLEGRKDNALRSIYLEILQIGIVKNSMDGSEVRSWPGLVGFFLGSMGDATRLSCSDAAMSGDGLEDWFGS